MGLSQALRLQLHAAGANPAIVISRALACSFFLQQSPQTFMMRRQAARKKEFRTSCT